MTFNASRGGLTPASEYYGNAIAGIETFPRQWQSAAKGTASGRMLLSYFTPSASRLCTQMLLVSDGTAAGATPTLVRAGVYTIAANGDGTLVAAILSDTALFAGANTEYVRNFDAGGGLPTSYTYVAGQRYAHAILVVSAAAMPSHPAAGPRPAPQSTRAPRINGYITAMADLPTTFLAASVSQDTNAVWSGAI